MPSPTVYELLNLDDPKTLYGLSARLVATESLLVIMCAIAVCVIVQKQCTGLGLSNCVNFNITIIVIQNIMIFDYIRYIK